MKGALSGKKEEKICGFGPVRIPAETASRSFRKLEDSFKSNRSDPQTHGQDAKSRSRPRCQPAAADSEEAAPCEPNPASVRIRIPVLVPVQLT